MIKDQKGRHGDPSLTWKEKERSSLYKRFVTVQHLDLNSLICWCNGDRTGPDDLPRVFSGETSCIYAVVLCRDIKMQHHIHRFTLLHNIIHLVDAFVQSPFLCSSTRTAIWPARWKPDRNKNMLTNHQRDRLYKAVFRFLPLNKTYFSQFIFTYKWQVLFFKLGRKTKECFFPQEKVFLCLPDNSFMLPACLPSVSLSVWVSPSLFSLFLCTKAAALAHWLWMQGEYI